MVSIRHAGLILLVRALWAGGAEGSKSCQMPVEEASELDIGRFRRQYWKRQPVLISGGAAGWARSADWSKAGFVAMFGDHVFSVRDRQKIARQGSFAPAVQSARVADILGSPDARETLVFSNVPTPLSLAVRERLDPRGLPVADIRGKPILSFGGKLGGLTLHRHDENWLGQLAGRKYWVLHEPSDSQPHMETPPCGYTKKKPANRKLKRCVSNVGDILYLPDAWWHATCNLDAWTLGVGGMYAIEPNPPAHFAAVLDDDADALGSALASPSAAVVAEASSFSRIWDPRKATPYHVAAMTGSVKMMDALEGLGVKLVDTCPVHTAAFYGQLLALRWLVSRGMGTSCHGVSNGAHWDLQQLPPVLVASKNGHLDVVRWLAEETSADVLLVWGGGRTALHYSAMDGHADVAEYLVKLAAGRRDYIDARDQDGYTAAGWAKAAGHPEVAKLLSKKTRKAAPREL